MKNVSSATTRSNGAARQQSTRRGAASRVTVAPASRLLSPGQSVGSPETGLAYEVERFLGEGGFGQVYLARRLGISSVVAETVCIKVSGRIDGWLREAYFGQVLEGHPRAIRVYDAFPLTQSDGRLLYCLALEYARHGDLRAFVYGGGAGWPEKTVRREIAGILEVLRKLHRGRLLHRDLTPMNIFVCDGPSLKLGDFGIVRQQSERGGTQARTMNALTAPSDILAGLAPKWQARDDVYQVGQLLGMLVKGDAGVRVRTSEIRSLRCSDHLKEIIHRCLGERRKRYENADDLIEALRNPPAALRVGALRSLAGVHLAFTGILSRRRSEAARAARRAGAVVHRGPSALTTVIVRGRPNPLQAAGKDAGLKLMEIKRLRAKGQRITLLDERRFWILAGRTRMAGRTRRTGRTSTPGRKAPRRRGYRRLPSGIRKM
jgi:serine/threonine-protein kinase